MANPAAVPLGEEKSPALLRWNQERLVPAPAHSLAFLVLDLSPLREQPGPRTTITKAKHEHASLTTCGPQELARPHTTTRSPMLYHIPEEGRTGVTLGAKSKLSSAPILERWPSLPLWALLCGTGNIDKTQNPALCVTEGSLIGDMTVSSSTPTNPSICDSAMAAAVATPCCTCRDGNQCRM